MLRSNHNNCGQKHMGKVLWWTLMTAEAVMRWSGEDRTLRRAISHILWFLFWSAGGGLLASSSSFFFQVRFGSHKSVAPVGSCLALPPFASAQGRVGTKWQGWEPDSHFYASWLQNSEHVDVHKRDGRRVCPQRVNGWRNLLSNPFSLSISL